MHIRTAVIVIFSLSALALSPDLIEAQLSDPSVAAQAPIPGSEHHYIGIGAETVNPADGALSFDLPLTPPAGRELSMTFGVRYFATDQFHLINNGGSLRWFQNLVTPYEVAGWSYQLPTYTGSAYDHFAGTVPPNNNPFYCTLTENYVFTGLDGVRRNLALGSQWLDPINPQGTCNTFPVNGTLSSNIHGWTVTSPTYTASPSYPALTVTGPSGTTYQFPGGFVVSLAELGNSDGPPAAWGLLAQTITDRNGNQISLKNNEVPNGAISYAANSYVDTLGRQIVAWSGLGNNGDTLTISGLSSSIGLKWGTATVHFPEHGHVASGTSDCQLAPNSTAPATIKFLTEIDLPNGQKYSFTPDSTNFGRVGRITFPGGGYVRYVWGLNSSSAIVNLVCSTSVSGPTHENWIFDVPAITDRYVSYDGSTEVLHQHFSYSPTTFSTNAWTTKATTVTSTDSITGQSTITKYSYVPTGVDLGVNDFSVWSSPEVPVEQTVQYQGGSGNTLRTVNKIWKNALVENGEQTVLDNGQGTIKLYCYDSNEQVTHVYEYGYQSEGAYPGNPSCVSSSGLNSSARGPLDRQTTTAYSSFTTHIVNAPSSVTVTDGAGNTAEQTLYFYDQSSLQASGATNLTNPGPQRANATKAQRLIGTTYATSTYTYFDTGQVASSTDPCGSTTCSDMSGSSHTTTYSYNDAYTILSGGQNVTYTPPSGNTNGMLTKVVDPLGHTQLFGYDYNNSQVTSSRDQNDINAGRTGTTYVYNDPLARPTQINYPDTGQTLMAYTDVAPPTVTTQRLISAGTYVANVATRDGLGHVVQTKLTQDPDCATGDLVSTTYDGMGRVHTQSNPYCTTGDPIYGLTTFTYDALGRTTKVANPDGTSATTSYTGRATDVVDEGNGTRSVERISQVDGLGRLGSMCEVTSSIQLGAGGTPSACGQDINKTGFVTAYTYNALDNLLSVKQGSLLNRTFSYDSLSRLLCAANPEMGGSVTCPSPDNGTYTAGTTRYSYDVNGNLATRMNPAPNQSNVSTTVTTSYQYDALNRLTQKSYSDGVTLPAQFGYDQSTITMGSQQLTIANSVGRLSSTCVLHSSGPQCPSMTGNSYDPIGRIAQVWQSDQVTSNNISVAYQYDLIGDETNRNLSGNQYALAYNSVGRLTAFTAQNFTDATNPANILASGHYDASGHLVSATLANGLSESWAYDNRVRPHAFALGTNCSAGTCTGSTVYSHSILNPSTGQTGYAPNGDILFANDNVNGNWAYTYDDFNRLASSNQNSGQQTYSYDYDRYGNRWHQNASGGSSMLLSFSGNNNRMDSYNYDAAGNLRNDGFHNYQYDPENRIISVDGNTTYTYDASGRRVFKSVGSTQTETIYDRQGNVILYNTTAAPNSPFIQIYAGGRHIGSYVVNSTVTDTIFYYNHADWLGTERARTNLSGVACETIASLPFGDGQTTAGSCGDISPMHFTGKERDSESGLDNFGARYNASTLGRFMTPDPLGGLRVDPQTLNKYAYVRNNPINLTDPTGLYTCKDDNNQCKSKQDTAFEKSRQQDLKSKDPNVVRAAKAYGDPTKDGPGGNKVSVGFADLSKKGEGGVTTSTISTDAKGNLVASSDVTINSKISGSELDAAVGHEGSHVGDAQDVVSSISLTNTAPYFKVGADISRYTSEQRAYAVTDSILRSENESAHFGCGVSDCILGTGLTMRGQLTDTIDRILSNSEIYRSNGQPLSPTNQGGSVVNGLVPQ